jgi:hypothetical protein
MPNWCDNDLRITGKKELLEAFSEAAASRDTHLDFNNFVPYPERYREQDKAANEAREKADKGEIDREAAWAVKDGFNSGGYEWCCSNWGTKWNAKDVSVSDFVERSMLYTFSTAWSPPIPVVKAMSEKFPKLVFTLRYYECGVGFKGVYKVKNGEVLDQMEGAYRGSRGG